MNNNESIIYKGYWWLPETPDNKVPGVLTYTPDKDIVLELIGSFNVHDFRQRIESINEPDKTNDLILGVDSDAKEISLINCYSSLSYNFNSTIGLGNDTIISLLSKNNSNM